MSSSSRTKKLAAVSLSAALWAVINWLISPIFWNITHLPILCDMLATSLLILTLWWTKSLGAPSLMGLVATALNFVLRPSAFHFLGFTAACFVFDITAYLIGYSRILANSVKGGILAIATSTASSAVAGFIIGTLFMNPTFLATSFGGVTFFAGLHAAGGLIGGILGVTFIRGLESRGIVGVEMT